MARFLSAAWFDEVEAARPRGSGTAGPQEEEAAGAQDHLIMRQVVTGTPDGEVSYLVVVDGERARVERTAPAPGSDTTHVQLTITCDWPTAAAIAQGRLSTQKALMQGRLRVRGSPIVLLGRRRQLANLDPVPPEVRRNTTY